MLLSIASIFGFRRKNFCDISIDELIKFCLFGGHGWKVHALSSFHAHRRWENELAPDWVTIHDLDEDEIQATLQNAISLGRMKKPTHTDSESILRGLGLFDDGHLMNAAVALYQS